MTSRPFPDLPALRLPLPLLLASLLTQACSVEPHAPVAPGVDDVDVPLWAPQATAAASTQPAAKTTLSLQVFAPFATRVAVAGDWNAWSEDAHVLERADDGTWRGSATVEAGDAYRLVVDTEHGERLWRIDPRAEEVTNSVGDAVVRAPFAWTDDDFVPVPWSEAVIYELHIGTFADEAGGAPGTFDSARARLDDLAALGVTHIELLPVAEFAADFSWGYNPAHLFAVEQAYGGPAALDRFVDAAHARGIAVLVDVVYNHLGPSDLDLWRFDGWSENDLGGVYFYNDDRAQTPWGHTRPDYGRAAVREFLVDNALFWIDAHHIDGLRFDSTGNIRARWYGAGEIPDGWSFLQQANDALHARGVVTVAEDLAGLDAITSSTEAGGAGFNAQWDASFVHSLRDALITARDEDRDLHRLRDALVRANLQRVVYSESHDEVANGRARVPEEVWPGNAGAEVAKQRALLGLAVVLTAPGVPMLFQGQELLEDGWFDDTDPLDWSKRDTHDDVWRRTRDLIHLRRNLGGATRGLAGLHINVHHQNHTDKVLAYHRYDQGGAGDDVVVVANFGHRTYGSYLVGFPRCGPWRVRGVEHDVTVEATAAPRDGLSCTASVALGPYEAVLLSQEP